MNILAMNFNHDGAAVVLSEGRITGFVNTERFSRIKKHPGVRDSDVCEVLAQAGLGLRDIDDVCVLNLGNMDSPEIPRRYSTTLKDTWVDAEVSLRAPLGSFSPRLTGAEITLRLRDHEPVTRPCELNPNHHRLHNATSYYFSPFEEAVCLAIDPVGYGAALGRGNTVEEIGLPRLPNVGWMYNALTQRLGFSGLFGAGKTMGLAPYAHADIDREDEVALAVELIEAGIDACVRRADAQPVMVRGDNAAWNATLAWYAQIMLETFVSQLLAYLYDYCISNGVAPNLCLSGGAALNSVANHKCFGRSSFDNLYLHPACGDDGTAIGAALYRWHHVGGHAKVARSNASAMYSIRDYSEQVTATIERHANDVVVHESRDYIQTAARLLAQGKVVGWYRGASEIGPRALGNRSILADPRDPTMKDKLNSRVKFREGFRPFAPAVVAEDASDWFSLDDSPFMLRVGRVLRDGIPAVTHEDGTARVQTVRRDDNPPYYDLIQAFGRQTGVPVLLNTSFNIRGEPIVETPDDAMRCFLTTGMDYLVMGGRVLGKRSPGDPDSTRLTAADAAAGGSR